MGDVYVVVVEKNVVTAIERSTDLPAQRIALTPLEVSTQLANNNRVNGCIDGRYHFDDPRRARIFAELCLEYTRALVEKRLGAIHRLPVGFSGYRADEDAAAPPDSTPS